MSIESAITFFIAMFIFGITPGPGVFAILARAMVQGPKKCVTLAAGMVTSDLIYLIFACFGLATIAENWAEVFVVIRYLGAAYLIYLGYKMFKDLPQVGDEVNSQIKELQASRPAASFMQGLLISASNPKVILFYISFLPTFIDLTLLSAQDILLVSVLSSSALIAGLMLIALGAGKLAKTLKTPLAHRRLNQGAGSIMIAAGSYLAINK